MSQANRTKLADDGMAMLERADAIADADNVVALHVAAAPKSERAANKIAKTNCQKRG